MFCTSCGKQMPDDAKFCPSCGHVVGEPLPEGQEPRQPEGTEASEPPPSVTPPVGPAYQPTVSETTPEQPAEPPAAPEPTPTGTTPPPQPTPSTPQPTAAPPPAAAQPTPSPVQPAAPTQVPPTPPTAPPTAPPTQPAGVPPVAEAPKKGGGKCWLIGCGILLAVGIIVIVLGFMCARRAKQFGEGLQDTLQNLPTNSLEIREPGEDGGGAGGIGGIIEGLGEAVSDIGAAASAADIKGFDPSSVDPAMLPNFYGFMIALAKDDPNEMHKFMSPSYRDQWSPDNWEPAPHIEHINFRMQSTRKVSDGEYEFVITERIRDNDADTEGDITWYITFSRDGGNWYVTSFE